METILFENEDIEDDDFICNRSLVKSLSLTISSTAGAVAALVNQKGSCSDAPPTRKKNSDKAKKTDLNNLTTQAEMFFSLQLNDFEFKNNFQMTRKTFEVSFF